MRVIKLGESIKLSKRQKCFINYDERNKSKHFSVNTNVSNPIKNKDANWFQVKIQSFAIYKITPKKCK